MMMFGLGQEGSSFRQEYVCLRYVFRLELIALENAETSAIGRALAAFGLGGTEFASADEVARAITGKPCAPVVDEPVEDWLAAIDEASDLEELEKTYFKAVEACPNSKKQIIAATNKRKAAIK